MPSVHARLCTRYSVKCKCSNINVTRTLTLFQFHYELSLFSLCVIPSLLSLNEAGYLKQTFILVSESAEQSACGLHPPFLVLNKVVHSAVKPLGWAVPLRTWERTVELISCTPDWHTYALFRAVNGPDFDLCSIYNLQLCCMHRCR